MQCCRLLLAVLAMAALAPAPAAARRRVNRAFLKMFEEEAMQVCFCLQIVSELYWMFPAGGPLP